MPDSPPAAMVRLTRCEAHARAAADDVRHARTALLLRMALARWFYWTREAGKARRP